ncbi:hypothetical protein [Castellaniella sp.]|uniref:hypothetical protein n=1 Tax=Castellaniella sp. TaxID=1955812 RepID=UPI002AFE52E4|nr:hypothetical protein [Castellaniella sp.]
MSSAIVVDPIARLLAGHGLTRQHLTQLADPALRVQAIAWLDGPADAQRQTLQRTLFPALIESMAGSDAVCLKGMTQGLTEQGMALRHRWHAIRADLSNATTALPDTLQSWIDDYLNYLQRADEELLPMASRLLDDDALDQLRRALA